MLLECLLPTREHIASVEWTKNGLFGYRLVFQPGEDHSTQGKMQLFDQFMRSGIASVILRNVSVADTGLYMCAVTTIGNAMHMQPINLTVTEYDEFVVHLDPFVLSGEHKEGSADYDHGFVDYEDGSADYEDGSAGDKVSKEGHRSSHSPQYRGGLGVIASMCMLVLMMAV